MADARIHTGFIRYRQVLDQVVDEIGVEQIFQAVQESLAAYDRETSAAFAAFVDTEVATTEYKFNHQLTTGMRYQPMTADDSPRPQAVTGFYEVGLPIRWGGTAYGLNRETRASTTVRMINDWVDEATIADFDWRRQFILKAMLWKDAWTFQDKLRNKIPDLTVYPFANNDTVTYQKINAADPSAANHYLAQAAAIADGANPFPTIFNTLREYPSNGLRQEGFVVTYVASNLVSDIEGLSTLQEVTDELIIPGISSDRVTNKILDWIGAGEKVIGYDSHNIIVEWNMLPTGKMISRAPSAPPLLRRRERPETGLRGLRTEMNPGDGNMQEIRLWRLEGYGVLNRVGGLCYHIGDATYQNPAAAFDPRRDD